LVGSDDDQRFVERVVVPALGSRYDFIVPWKYAHQKAGKVNAFLKSIKEAGAHYLLLGSLHAYPCFPRRRDALLQRFSQLDGGRVLVVVKEIASWYLAGLPAENSLGVTVPAETSLITQEHFYSTIPKGFDSRIDYALEVLKLFDIQVAAGRNPSFHYFARGCGLL